MSHLPEQLGHLTFYLTHPAPCPYLDGQVEQKIFTRLSGDPKSDFFLNSAMNQHGFRRSQTMVYRPACPACMACVPVRIAVNAFVANKRLRRTAKINADLSAHFLPVTDSDPLFDLFRRYQRTRHGEGEMADMGRAEFNAMMQEGGANSFLLALRDAEGLTLAAMLTDQLHHGASAVYSFYEPAATKRSLGTELILRLVTHLRQQNQEYAYLGYWIKESRKMAYKSGFPALQRLGSAGWEDITP